MNEKLSEKENDALAVAQSEDENVWTDEYLKERAKRGAAKSFCKR